MQQNFAFHQLLVLHNHSKTHTSTFYLIPKLKVLSKQVYSSMFLFFFISIANKRFVKKLYSMTILFRY